jgi:tRNA U34 2-thiouridine synthase MnmA/TrmU
MINYIDKDNKNCQTKEDIKMAKKVAKYLDIPFFTFNYVKEYKKSVFNYMYE